MTVQIYNNIVQYKPCLPYLYSRKPVCRKGWRTHVKLSHSPSFIVKFIDYSKTSNKIYILALVCAMGLGMAFEVLDP